MVDTIVLRFDSRTKRDERNARFARRINQMCLDNPDLVSEYHMFVDESTLGAAQHGPEYVPYEPLLEDSERMPRISSAQVSDAARFSERIRAIENIPLERKAQYGDSSYN
jgi:histone deacetylase complex regulatory component SIN3